MGFGPYKCPECGVWWAGFEHRCHPTILSGNTNTISVGHCHACSSFMCNANDDEPCSLHRGGYTTSVVGYRD